MHPEMLILPQVFEQSLFLFFFFFSLGAFSYTSNTYYSLGWIETVALELIGIAVGVTTKRERERKGRKESYKNISLSK